MALSEKTIAKRKKEYFKNMAVALKRGDWKIIGTQVGMGVSFAYTVGRSLLGRRELLLAGVNIQYCTSVFHDIHDREKEKEIERGKPLDFLIRNFDCYLLEANPEIKEKYRLHGGVFLEEGYPLDVIIFPDPKGKFPWEEGFDMGIPFNFQELYKEAPVG